MVATWASFWGVIIAIFGVVLWHEWSKDHE